ncbi:hypothetical protein MA16_Dca001596 [Dendrobium catenatum]|uniref:Uncharacterized protein n=1 Tax=Dendrobium catenatum TaxID=906689 RepID=A0A2I0WMV0_9ASPA|nr:hypothetical protein MA16_Dca001596 [Dendrobium catenatum]
MGGGEWNKQTRRLCFVRVLKVKAEAESRLSEGFMGSDDFDAGFSEFCGFDSPWCSAGYPGFEQNFDDVLGGRYFRDSMGCIV